MSLLILGVFVSIILFFCFLYSFSEMMQKDSREFFDPLPWWLRFIWPRIRFFSVIFSCCFPVRFFAHYQPLLNKAGLKYLVSSLDCFSLKFFSDVVSLVVIAIIMILIDINQALYWYAGGLLFWFLPDLKLRELIKKRNQKIVLSLPIFIDFMVMALSSGLSFLSAFSKTLQFLPSGPLKSEFSDVMRDIRSGSTKRDALLKCSEGIDMREIRLLVSVILQAEKTGGNLVDILKVQADQLLEERFQLAEKMALEAPVKMIFPLVMFIFPVTFIVLFFPIVIQLFYS